MARPEPGDVKPTARLSPIIGKSTRVSTAGSCFAQHIAKTMAQNGLAYHVTEPGPSDMDRAEKEKLNYGLFSARYGNIYSPRQLLQLIRRAYGRFQPVHTAWEAKSGGYIDPFRPNIGETFESVKQLEEDRKRHLAAVREMFETLDVFVFTMGLTECWVDSLDGSAFPVAPGVVSNTVNASTLEFRNFDSRTVHDDMVAFFEELKRVNPDCNIILTVSPVPLIATYSPNDALTATTYSKSVLRAAAGELEQSYEFVHYFPSFEIITGQHAMGRYYESDLRSVRSEGVAHVMRVFMEALVQSAELPTADILELSKKPLHEEEVSEEYRREMDVVCDEELIVNDL